MCVCDIDQLSVSVIIVRHIKTNSSAAFSLVFQKSSRPKPIFSQITHSTIVQDYGDFILPNRCFLNILGSFVVNPAVVVFSMADSEC